MALSEMYLFCEPNTLFCVQTAKTHSERNVFKDSGLGVDRAWPGISSTEKLNLGFHVTEYKGSEWTGQLKQKQIGETIQYE